MKKNKQLTKSMRCIRDTRVHLTHRFVTKIYQGETRTHSIRDAQEKRKIQKVR
jgi:hypothetical protein